MFFEPFFRLFKAGTMKAIRVHTFGGPEVLKLETDVPIPIHTETQVTQLHYIQKVKSKFTISMLGFDSSWCGRC